MENSRTSPKGVVDLLEGDEVVEGTRCLLNFLIQIFVV